MRRGVTVAARVARAAVIVACGGVATSVTVAHANGRPPVTNGVTFDPADNHSLFIRSTFGLLVSHDDGCSFRWACEQSIGYGGAFDPEYAIGANGTLYATTYDGLRVSRDGGCTFVTATSELPDGAPGRIAGLFVDSISIGATGDVWVATADGAHANSVYRSTDGGQTFASVGASLPALWWKSVVVAPASPLVAYAAGYQVATSTPTTQAFMTRDAGATWTELSLAGVKLGATPVTTIAAVDAAASTTLFLTSVGAAGPEGDRLYRSVDGGLSFTEVLATTRPVVSVVIRPGGVVLAVSGDGTYRSTDGGVTFGPGAPVPKLGCLGTRPDGTLVSCAANWDPDFMAVATSPDGAQYDKLMRFAQLAGPLACPAGTPSHDLCDPLWPALQMQFGATGPTDPSCAAPSEPLEPPVETPPTMIQPGGCCDVSDGSPAAVALLAALTAVLASRGGRRRTQPKQ